MSLIDRAVEFIRANGTDIRDHYAVAEVLAGLDANWSGKDEYEKRALVTAAIYRCERQGVRRFPEGPTRIN